MESELARFNLSQAPLLRAVLFHEPHRVILLLSIVHSIKDGMSGTFLVRDLLTVLSGGHLEPLPLLPAMETLLERLPAGTSSSLRLPALPAGRTAVLVPDDTRSCVTRRSLDRLLTAALRDRARREEASVFGALCAAAVLARQSESTQAMPVILSYPIDIRTMLGVGEDNLYMLSGARMEFPIGAASPSRDQVWVLARAAREHVKSTVAPDVVRASIGWLEQQFQGTTDPVAMLSKFGAFFASDIHLTNLGQIRLETDMDASNWRPAGAPRWRVGAAWSRSQATP